MRAAMVSWTRPALARFRFRLALLEEAKWRRPGFRRRSLPDAVNLNRFEAAFFVFRRAMDLGMGRWTIQASACSATPFLHLPPIRPSASVFGVAAGVFRRAVTLYLIIRARLREEGLTPEPAGIGPTASSGLNRPVWLETVLWVCIKPA